eukprot:277091-Prorocentrum_minimum.AAC.1
MTTRAGDDKGALTTRAYADKGALAARAGDDKGVSTVRARTFAPWTPPGGRRGRGPRGPPRGG